MVVCISLLEILELLRMSKQCFKKRIPLYSCMRVDAEVFRI